MNKLNKIIKIQRIKDAFRRKKEAEKKKNNPKGETVESLRQKFYDFGARSLVFALAILLSGCALFTEEKVIYSTIYPSLPPLQEPNVLTLNACEWTYPEMLIVKYSLVWMKRISNAMLKTKKLLENN